jgi:hypothetical protein
MRPARTPLLALALTVVATAGCGSTVQQQASTGTLPTDGLSSDGLVDGGTTGATPPAGSAGQGTTVTGGSGVGTTGGLTSGSGGTSGSNSTGGAAPSVGRPTTPSALTTGVGVTKTTITVGVTITSNGDAANAAIGAGGITQGDGRANVMALRDEINATGGIAGRKLEVVVHAYDAQSTQTGATQDAAACSTFTEDNKVMAVFSGSLSDVLPECLRKAGVVQFFAGGLVARDKAFARDFPLAFQLGTMTQERILKDLVGALSRQKYFSGWNTLTGGPSASTPTKVAVLSYDSRAFQNAVKNTLLPELRAAGHPVADQHVFYIRNAENQAAVSNQVAAIKSATLRMQQDGITHVVFNDSNGLLLGLFGTNAQSQQFFPRFGVTSGAGPQAIHDSGLVTPEQLNGMAGNGWLPTIDLPAEDGTKLATKATARCLDIMKRRTGQTYTSTNAASIALIECDSFFLFATALAKAPALTAQGLVAGMESLGGSYTSALLPASFLSPQQHDNGVRAWDQNWVADCTCVRYTAQRSVPS